MAIDKAIDSAQLDAGLTRVADKVREKAGTSEMLVFPDGYESALDTIESADSALAEVESILSNGYTNYRHYFSNQSQLTEVPVSLIRHTSTGKSFYSMFNGCIELTEIPSFDVSSGTDFSSTFANLKKVVTLPPFDTSKGTEFSGTFYYCSVLETIQGIDLSSGANFTNMFSGCSALKNITFNGTIKITGLDLSPCKNLTHDSLMSAINALYDYVSEGTSGTFKVTLGSTNKAKLTEDELHIALSKGWTVS